LNTYKRIILEYFFRNIKRWILTSSGESLSVSRAIFGTMLPLGDRCLSIVPPGLLGGKMRGFSVATLARRPLIVEDVGWFEFATLGDARRRRDEALRCNITATSFYPCDTIHFPILSFTKYFARNIRKKLLASILIFDPY